VIKIIKATHKTNYNIELFFSDGKKGIFDATSLVDRKSTLTKPLVDRKSTLTKPLVDPEYFQAFFIELGALCWKNGFELGPSSLYQNLKEANLLTSASDRAA